MADKESSTDFKIQVESKQSLNVSTLAEKESSADFKMQDETKQPINLSIMAVDESSADFKMQAVNQRDLVRQQLKQLYQTAPIPPYRERTLTFNESKQSLNHSTMADKKSIADVKMQDESKQYLNHSTMADKKSIADVMMQDESKESLNPSTMAVKESSSDVKMQELNQHERLQEKKRFKQTVPLPRTRETHNRFRRIPVFDEEDDLFSSPTCPSPPVWIPPLREPNIREFIKPERPEVRGPPLREPTIRQSIKAKRPIVPKEEKCTKSMGSTFGQRGKSAQFQQVLFIGNPVDKGGEPRIRHPIKQQRPKIVRDIVPTVINPDLQDPTERRA